MHPSECVYEIVHLGFRPDVAVEDQRQHMAALTDVLRKQPGFLERHAFRDPASGRWVDLVRWSSAAAAQAAMGAVMSLPAVQAAMAAMDQDTMVMGHHALERHDQR